MRTGRTGGDPTSVPPPGTDPAPVVVDDADLDALEAVLDRLEAAQRGRGSVVGAQAAVRALARAGALADGPAGAPTPGEYTRRARGADGDRHADRPWVWLAAVVAAAAGRRPALVARAAGFVVFWVQDWSPHLTPTDEALLRIPRRVPPEALLRIRDVALEVLGAMPPDTVVVADPRPPGPALTVADVVAGCHRLWSTAGARPGPDRVVSATRRSE